MLYSHNIKLRSTKAKTIKIWVQIQKTFTGESALQDLSNLLSCFGRKEKKSLSSFSLYSQLFFKSFNSSALCIVEEHLISQFMWWTFFLWDNPNTSRNLSNRKFFFRRLLKMMKIHTQHIVLLYCCFSCFYLCFCYGILF